MSRDALTFEPGFQKEDGQLAFGRRRRGDRQGFRLVPFQTHFAEQRLPVGTLRRDTIRPGKKRGNQPGTPVAPFGARQGQQGLLTRFGPVRVRQPHFHSEKCSDLGGDIEKSPGDGRFELVAAGGAHRRDSRPFDRLGLRTVAIGFGRAVGKRVAGALKIARAERQLVLLRAEGFPAGIAIRCDVEIDLQVIALPDICPALGLMEAVVDHVGGDKQVFLPPRQANGPMQIRGTRPAVRPPDHLLWCIDEMHVWNALPVVQVSVNLDGWIGFQRDAQDLRGRRRCRYGDSKGQGQHDGCAADHESLLCMGWKCIQYAERTGKNQEKGANNASAM